MTDRAINIAHQIALPEEPQPLSPRAELVAITSVCVVAAFLRFMDLGRLQLSGSELQFAWNLMAGEETASFSAIRDMATAALSPDSSQPMLGALIARWMWFLPFGRWFDWSPQFLRMISAAAALLTIPMVWAAGRAAFGPRHGIAAAFLLAICPLHVWASRNLGADVLLGIEFAAVLWFLFAKQLVIQEWRPIPVGVLCGTMMATAFEGALLTPFVLAAVMINGPSQSGNRNVGMLAGGVAAAVGVWCLFCDPLQYIAHLAQSLNAGGFNSVLLPLLLLAPGTLIAGLVIAAIMLRERCDRVDVAMWAMLIGCLLPVFMISPDTSSPFPLIPLMFAASLLASRIIELPRNVSDVFLGLHGLLALLPLSWFIAGFMTLAAPPGIRETATVDPFYEAARPWLFDRQSHPLVLMPVSPGEMRRRHSIVLKSVALSEGAVVLAAGSLYWPDGDCRFADVALWWSDPSDSVSGSDAVFVPPACMEEMPGDSIDWTVYARKVPTAFDEGVPFTEMEEFETRGGWQIRQIPDYWIPVTGRFALEWKDGRQLNAEIADRPSAVLPRLLQSADSGTLIVDRVSAPVADAPDIVLRFVAPTMSDAIPPPE